MGRVIKFRAWNKKKGWMIPSGVGEFIDFEGEYYTGASTTYDTPNREIEIGDEVVLMQFTGLTDKNGKEIWEGDIVQFQFNKDWCEGNYLPQEKFEVSLEIHRLWCKGERFGEEGEMLLDPRDSEVIGNIYEHPHLLKGDA